MNKFFSVNNHTKRNSYIVLAIVAFCYGVKAKEAFQTINR